MCDPRLIALLKQEHPDLTVLQNLLDEGVDVNADVDSIQTALSLALSHPDVKVAELMINHPQFKITEKTIHVLNRAIILGYSDLANKILDRDTSHDLNSEPNGFSQTLFHAIAAENIQLINRLLTLGANPKKESYFMGKSQSPLDYAMSSGKVGCVEAIENHLSITESAKDNPEDEEDPVALAKFLKSRIKPIDTIHNAILNNQPLVALAALDNLNETQRRDIDKRPIGIGVTALASAVMKNYPEVARKLKALGANIHCSSGMSYMTTMNTPLRWCVFNNNKEMLQILLENVPFSPEMDAPMRDAIYGEKTELLKIFLECDGAKNSELMSKCLEIAYCIPAYPSLSEYCSPVHDPSRRIMYKAPNVEIVSLLLQSKKVILTPSLVARIVDTNRMNGDINQLCLKHIANASLLFPHLDPLLSGALKFAVISRDNQFARIKHAMDNGANPNHEMPEYGMSMLSYAFNHYEHLGCVMYRHPSFKFEASTLETVLIALQQKNFLRANSLMNRLTKEDQIDFTTPTGQLVLKELLRHCVSEKDVVAHMLNSVLELGVGFNRKNLWEKIDSLLESSNERPLNPRSVANVFSPYKNSQVSSVCDVGKIHPFLAAQNPTLENLSEPDKEYKPGGRFPL